MKISLQILFLLLMITSCKSEKQKRFEKEIIGEWNYVKEQAISKQKENESEEPSSPFFKSFGGFIFKENGNVIDKKGFFNFYENKSREERIVKYIGDSTLYKINDDSLKILNPINKSWNNYKIISINSDSLILQKHENYYIKYLKANYKLNPKETYDKIIISSSGCYGTCPIMNIEFNKNGNIYYWGKNYNLINGFYISKISNSEYNSIENSFKKSNPLKLNNHYSIPVTDLNTITVTFVKNNKIIKTVYDYANQAPSEFIMAYQKAMYSYQKMKLEKDKRIVRLPKSMLFSINKRNTQLLLLQSERFLLLNAIRNGNIVSKEFNPIYKLTFYNEHNLETENIIYSDGRYFRFDKYIYDIGYNFMEQNQIENRTESPYY